MTKLKFSMDGKNFEFSINQHGESVAVKIKNQTTNKIQSLSVPWIIFEVQLRAAGLGHLVPSLIQMNPIAAMLYPSINTVNN